MQIKVFTQRSKRSAALATLFLSLATLAAPPAQTSWAVSDRTSYPAKATVPAPAFATAPMSIRLPAFATATMSTRLPAFATATMSTRLPATATATATAPAGTLPLAIDPGGCPNVQFHGYSTIGRAQRVPETIEWNQAQRAYFVSGALLPDWLKNPPEQVQPQPLGKGPVYILRPDGLARDWAADAPERICLVDPKVSAHCENGTLVVQRTALQNACGSSFTDETAVLGPAKPSGYQMRFANPFKIFGQAVPLNEDWDLRPEYAP